MENKIYSYKKSSHFSDMLLKINNKPDKITSYTNKQFEEDLKKWVSEINNEKMNGQNIKN